jgi:hypothetical protein
LNRGMLWQSAVDSLDPPRDVGELMLLVRAHAELGNFPEARRLLDQHGATVDLPAATKNEMTAWLFARESLS